MPTEGFLRSVQAAQTALQTALAARLESAAQTAQADLRPFLSMAEDVHNQFGHRHQVQGVVM
jgi:hypothetical protein